MFPRQTQLIRMGGRRGGAGGSVIAVSVSRASARGVDVGAMPPTSVRDMPELQRIAVYCGARNGNRDVYLAAARGMGQALASRGVGLVYGGGAVGLMGALADGALAAGGEVVGVIPAFMDGRESIHGGLSELRISRSMHDRKATMLDLADAVIALPGGLGTLDEFVEALTWAQLGLHRIPCGLLDVGEFWEPLVALIDHAIGHGFVDAAMADGIVRSHDPLHLIDALAGSRIPGLRATESD